MGLLFVLLALFFGGFGLASAQTEEPRGTDTYTVPAPELGPPPRIATPNAPDG